MFACPKISIKLLEISEEGAKRETEREGVSMGSGRGECEREGKLTLDNWNMRYKMGVTPTKQKRLKNKEWK